VEYLSVEITAHEPMKMSGVATIRVYDPDGTLVDERTCPNIMCTTGYGILAQALAWSLALDQNATLGILLTPTYGAPAWGAVGSGVGNVTTADTVLFSELGRSTVYSATTNGSAFTLLFFFGTTTSNWTIAEAGVFLQATSTGGSGSLLDHVLISPTVSKTTSQTATLSLTFTMS